jgi:osmotically-inducible protein OsmY
MSDTIPQEQAEQAEAVLRQQLSRRVWELRVQTCEEGVILRGYTFTWYAKQLAQHAAMQVLGLRVLANEIEVRRALPPPDPGDPDLG